MRRTRILGLVLMLALSLSISCSKLTKRGDDAIATDIKAQMFSEPALKSASVDVTTKDGVVTLAGQVPDDAARLAAYKIATGTQGVTKVNDQMSVASAQSAPAAAEPATPAPVETPKPARTRTSRPKQSVTPQQPAVASAAPPYNPPPTDSGNAVYAPAAPPPPQPVTVTVPSNTVVTVRTIDAIDSATNHAGEVFKASLDAPIVVDNKVIVPTGADAYLKLINASSAGHISGRSELSLALTSVVFQGKTYNVETSDVKQSGASRGKRSAATIGGGAALGALIGAVAGGGKGAAIGAAVGGGAGTGVQVLTKGQQVKIPSETRLDFTLQQPVDITYLPGKKSRQHSTDSTTPNQ
jgi:hypothetical protein